MRSLAPRLVAEVVGTFFLVFFGAAAGTLAGGDVVRVALAHGFALTIAVLALGAVSGAHVNPAVTIALAARKRISWPDAGAYIAAQLVGAFIGGLVVWAVTGGVGVRAGLGATHVSPGFSTAGALIAEIAGTFLLVSAVYLLCVRERVPFGVAGVGVGIALGAGILAVGTVTGASFNPARTIGPELALTIAGGGSHWSTIWLYLLGPVLGGLLAVLLYDYVVDRVSQAPRP
jgi:glycerol uptake facilitator protein